MQFFPFVTQNEEMSLIYKKITFKVLPDYSFSKKTKLSKQSQYVTFANIKSQSGTHETSHFEGYG